MLENDILDLRENYELIERFINNVTEFCDREDIDENKKNTVKNMLEPIQSAFIELKELIHLSPSEENISKIKQLIGSITLKEMWDIDEVMNQEIKKIDNVKKDNQQKLVKFIKKSVANIKQKITDEIEKMKSENKKLGEDNKRLKEELEDLEEKRDEIESLPTTCLLVKKENPLRRFIRIMTEKPELWNEVEDGNRIVLRNNEGEIRGEIPKESEDNKEAIVQTEKAIIKAKKKYSFLQRLKNLTKSEVFAMEPEAREQELNRNYLDIVICKGKIENNINRITGNSKRMEKISKSYEVFIEKIGNILDNHFERDSLGIISKLVDEIEEFENDMGIEEVPIIDDFETNIEIVSKRRTVEMTH